MDWEWTKDVRAVGINNIYNAANCMMSWAVQSGTGSTVVQDRWQGTLVAGKTPPVLAEMSLLCDMRDDASKVYVGPRTAIQIESHEDGHTVIEYAGFDPEVYARLKDWCDANVSTDAKSAVLSIENAHQGPVLRHLGYDAQPLVRENYTDDVLQKFDAVVKSWTEGPTHGRVAILTGPPGTGKTHLVRGFMHAIQGAGFVVLPHGMLESLGGPSLIGLLADAAEMRRKLVFVLEDADDALVARDQGNMHLISSLLNLGDGLLGAALDLFVICTTNRKSNEIDPAILRAGRLAGKMDLKGLRKDQARRVLQRLNPRASLPEPTENNHSTSVGFGADVSAPSWTLAELYEAARVGNDTE